MKQSVKKFFAVFFTCLMLLGASFQNSVVFANTTQYRDAQLGEANTEAALGWGAIAAGVAAVGAVAAAVKGAYDIGTIVGNALYDAFGPEEELQTATVLDIIEAQQYDRMDFATFDPAT